MVTFYSDYLVHMIRNDSLAYIIHAPFVHIAVEEGLS